MNELIKELDNAITVMEFVLSGQKVAPAELVNRIDMAKAAIENAAEQTHPLFGGPLPKAWTGE